MEYKLGASGLRSICESILTDAMFELPSSKENKFNVDIGICKEEIRQEQNEHVESSIKQQLIILNKILGYLSRIILSGFNFILYEGIDRSFEGRRTHRRTGI